WRGRAEPVAVGDSPRGEGLPEARDRIDALPGAPRLRRVAAARRERRVALPAARLALDEPRAVAPARVVDRLLRGAPDGEDVVPVDDAGRHPEAARAVGDIRRRLALRRRDGDRK